MTRFQFKCRSTDVQHCCADRKHRIDVEPDHPPELLSCIADAIEAGEAMEFYGMIKSPVNNYQTSLDFDNVWAGRMAQITGWQDMPLRVLKAKVPAELRDVSDINPDYLLIKNGTTVAVEIEKTNNKTIWFDIIKILMLIEQQVANVGLLLVPRNYAHRHGEWNLFNDARYYRSCLIRFAKVDPYLLSKLAIIGYTNEVLINNTWAKLDKAVLSDLKAKARNNFQDSKHSV